jgi:hypothetical protein
VLQLVQERQVEFFGTRDGARMICDPPLALNETAADDDEARTTTVCTDGASEAKLDAEFREPVEMRIGGETVRAIRLFVAGTVTGRVNGTSTDDFYFDPDTGMTVKWVRTVDTKADAFGGAKVRYQEDASFVLESLDPKA